MNCLHCKGVIPLVKSLSRRKTPFCSSVHEEAYRAELQRLMLARLMETGERYTSSRVRHLAPTFTAVNRQEKEERCTALALRTLATT